MCLFLFTIMNNQVILQIIQFRKRITPCVMLNIVRLYHSAKEEKMVNSLYVDNNLDISILSHFSSGEGKARDGQGKRRGICNQIYSERKYPWANYAASGLGLHPWQLDLHLTNLDVFVVTKNIPFLTFRDMSIFTSLIYYLQDLPYSRQHKEQMVQIFCILTKNKSMKCDCQGKFKV